MSGLLAIIDGRAGGSGADRKAVDRMLATLARRGDRSEVWRGDGAVVCGTRFEWEMSDGFAGREIIVCDGDLVVVADASIYYRVDLERKLHDAGVRPTGSSAAHVIGAAFRAWGTSCPEHLEGDYAFVVYDRRRRSVFAARDFMGRRPLYYARVGDALVIASTVGAILEHPVCPRDFDEVHLADLISVGMADPERTPYSAVKALPAASSLFCDGDQSLRATTYWSPTLDEDDARLSLDAAAEQLRELLANAILERCASHGRTVLWLSGGYDSAAIYGIGNNALDRRGLDRLHPISFSHPLGDPAREDELIDEIARFWNTAPTWLSIGDVPLLADTATQASESDIPFQHAFENWLRALFAATELQGSRVALYGDGGDQLFAVSGVFLRDLFSTFQWRELRREWSALGGRSASALWRAVVRPALEEGVGAVRHPNRPHITAPSWVRREFVQRHQLEARQAQAEALLASGGGRADAETRGSLANPIVPRVLTGFSALALAHSTEVRAPLLDRRVVELALRRPRWERASGGAVKHLLRRAARGLLPESVTAPRQGAKTGVLSSYFAGGFRSDPGGVVTRTLKNSVLEELGLVDAATLQQAWHAYKSGGGGGGELFLAFQVELWLRARLTRSSAAIGAANR